MITLRKKVALMRAHGYVVTSGWYSIPGDSRYNLTFISKPERVDQFKKHFSGFLKVKWSKRPHIPGWTHRYVNFNGKWTTASVFIPTFEEILRKHKTWKGATPHLLHQVVFLSYLDPKINNKAFNDAGTVHSLTHILVSEPGYRPPVSFVAELKKSLIQLEEKNPWFFPDLPGMRSDRDSAVWTANCYDDVSPPT